MQYVKRFFGSLSDMVETVRELPYKAGDNERGFYGGSWDETYRYAERGWAEGARKAAKVSTSIANRIVHSTSSALVPEVVYEVTGAAYDPGAYISGQPECWMAFEPREEKRAIKIAVNIAVSGGVRTGTFERRGLAIAALAMALNAQGHPITVDVVQCLRHGYNRHNDSEPETMILRVSDAMSGSILDVDRMTYCLAHPTIFRRLFSAATNGYRGHTCGTHWGGAGLLMANETPKIAKEYDLWLGAGHLYDVQRWQDGGEEWVMKQYLEQTSA